MINAKSAAIPDKDRIEKTLTAEPEVTLMKNL